MNFLKFICCTPVGRRLTSSLFNTPEKTYAVNQWGLRFKNAVGLAAGFDKNARWLRELSLLGFGFIEIGTVTPLAQPGNEKPRLFRLPKDKAIINRMGFNNDGVQQVAQRLRIYKSQNHNQGIIIGGNIGKNKSTPNEEAWKDYEACFRALFDVVDYFVVNVSSPNTPNLRALQDKASLRKILTHLQEINRGFTNPRPILLKIAPDLNKEQLDDVVDLALEIKLDGIIATNTTINRHNLSAGSALLAEDIGSGGLSGAPLKERSTQVVRYLNRKSKGYLPIIASGGIFTAEDANEKIAAGACLVQVWTGFIYQGPRIVKEIVPHLYHPAPGTD